MVQKEIQKLTLIINAVILALVFALAGLFVLVGASFLIWFSIPTALIYIIGFVDKSNEHKALQRSRDRGLSDNDRVRGIRRACLSD